MAVQTLADAIHGGALGTVCRVLVQSVVAGSSVNETLPLRKHANKIAGIRVIH